MVDVGRELLEARGDERQAGDHAGFARHHDGARLGVFRNGRDRCDIAGPAEVLGESARDDGIDFERRQEGVGAEQ